ncbi:MAG: hypothetical protein RBG13Loki_3269 [Promethearchaeota archaeon CR_4]|nr:MAG: hypothetical protein RBG13Loki_3269 [Candidatus Lokiarchaeota archaeon CR_4]
MKKCYCIFIFILPFLGFWLFAGLTENQPPANSFPHSATITSPQLWNDTLPLVEALPLTLSEHSTTSEMVNGKNLTVKDVSFESLNFANSTDENLTMRGYLVLPDNQSGTLGTVPAILLLHGLLMNTSETLPWAKSFAVQDFIVLCYDHPGHGRSGGPTPNITNFYNTAFIDHYNETSHLYLSNCATLQAIRVLEAQEGVNTSQLVIGGISYGGLNAMIAGSIYRSKIKAIISCIAAGDFLTSMKSEGKFIRLMAGGYNPQFEEVYDQVKEIWDPLYYINELDFPPMLLLCGTTDDFFDLVAFNATFSALQSPARALSITANGHHVFSLDDPTPFYWVNATLFGDPHVPQISLESLSILEGVLGTQAEVNFTIGCPIGTVARVEVVYAHVDLLGRYWYSLPSVLSSTGDYSVMIPAPVLDSRTMYFIRVTTTTGAVFTSAVYQVKLGTWLTSIIWGFLLFAIAGPILILVRYRLKEIRRAETAWEGIFPANVRRNAILDFSILLLNGFNLYLAIALTWVDFSGTDFWTGTYIMNDYFTQFGNWLVPVLVVILLVGFILSLRFPLVLGVWNLSLPILAGLLWSFFTGTGGFLAFAPPTLGSAIYLMLLYPTVTIVMGIYRTRYWRPIKRVLKECTRVRKSS